MANWPTQRLKELGYTREQFAALSLQERNEILGKSKEVVPDSSPTEQHNAPPASRPKLEARASSKPKAKTWAMKAGNNWETAADSEENPDEFYIPRDKFPEGMDLQWWTREVFGQETRQRIATARRGGWTEVHESDFDGWHNRVLGNKYIPDDSGYIVHKACILMARPEEISAKAKRRDQQKAREQIDLKSQAFKGGEMAATGANHPSALATNRINRTMERIDIPKE